jgi:hypothetical protein
VNPLSDAERALACMRRLYERRAGRLERLSFGVAVITPELPLIRALNFVLVDRWDGEADALSAASEEVQARLGFAHRSTVLLD